MARYLLEDTRENERLEKQSKLRLYAPEGEWPGTPLPPDSLVLDAGCGTGLMGRFLGDRYPGIRYIGGDLSAERLAQARGLNPGQEYQTLDLFKWEDYAALEGKVDLLFNRYVMHHIREHEKVLAHFHRVLKQDGQLCLVDIDGVFTNVGCTNAALRTQIEQIAAGFGGDLYAARRMPALLKQVGFRDVHWEVQVMDFHGQDREDEVEQFRERLEYGRETFTRVLGGELAYKRFVKDYLAELASPTTAVFYNKFVIQAKK